MEVYYSSIEKGWGGSVDYPTMDAIRVVIQETTIG